MKPSRILPFIVFFFAATCNAQEFERSALTGLWAESVNTKPACAEDNLHHHFELSEDGKTLVFKLDRKWRIASGEAVESYSATVVSSTNRKLVIRYNSDIGTLPVGYPTEWELAFVAPDVYRWRATEWPEGKVNPVVGVRCAP